MTRLACLVHDDTDRKGKPRPIRLTPGVHSGQICTHGLVMAEDPTTAPIGGTARGPSTERGDGALAESAVGRASWRH
jgi:hypothetical protein